MLDYVLLLSKCGIRFCYSQDVGLRFDSPKMLDKVLLLSEGNVGLRFEMSEKVFRLPVAP